MARATSLNGNFFKMQQGGTTKVDYINQVRMFDFSEEPVYKETSGANSRYESRLFVKKGTTFRWEFYGTDHSGNRESALTQFTSLAVVFGGTTYTLTTDTKSCSIKATTSHKEASAAGDIGAAPQAVKTALSINGEFFINNGGGSTSGIVKAWPQQVMSTLEASGTSAIANLYGTYSLVVAETTFSGNCELGKSTHKYEKEDIQYYDLEIFGDGTPTVSGTYANWLLKSILTGTSVVDFDIDTGAGEYVAPTGYALITSAEIKVQNEEAIMISGEAKCIGLPTAE